MVYKKAHQNLTLFSNIFYLLFRLLQQQCPEAQKLAVAHIKERLKKVG